MFSKFTAFFKKALISSLFGAAPDVIICFLAFIPSIEIVLLGSCFEPINHNIKCILLEFEAETVETFACFVVVPTATVFTSTKFISVYAKTEIFVTRIKTIKSKRLHPVFLVVFNDK